MEGDAAKCVFGHRSVDRIVIISCMIIFVIQATTLFKPFPYRVIWCKCCEEQQMSICCEWLRGMQLKPWDKKVDLTTWLQENKTNYTREQRNQRRRRFEDNRGQWQCEGVKSKTTQRHWWMSNSSPVFVRFGRFFFPRTEKMMQCRLWCFCTGILSIWFGAHREVKHTRMA